MTHLEIERTTVMYVKDRILDRLVEDVLRSLHIPGTLKGLSYLTYAVSETVKDPKRTELITKDLYHEIARLYGTKALSVEHAMRGAIRVSWETARNELDQMAGYHLVKRPTNKEFIDHIAFYIRNK